MNKVAQRLLVFFIGVPIMAGLVYFKQLNHIVLQCIVVLANLIATNELYTMFSKSFDLQPKKLLLTLAPIPALLAILCSFTGLSVSLINYAFIFTIFIAMAIECFTAKTFEKSNSKIITSSFILLYCSYLGTFISRMAFFKYSREHLLTFFVMVFFCDSFAWLFGNLFGKNNKGYVKVSPNKSIAGFIGGFIGSVLIGLAAKYIWPDVFPGTYAVCIAFGLLIGLTSIVGDLVESLLKRSSDVKDSGTLMPGRGGLLDCMDSLIYTAPVYYLVSCALFNA